MSITPETAIHFWEPPSAPNNSPEKDVGKDSWKVQRSTKGRKTGKGNSIKAKPLAKPLTKPSNNSSNKSLTKGLTNPKNGGKPNYQKRTIPPAVQQQFEFCRKYAYHYRIMRNGNIQNNSTLYVRSETAHPDQIKQLFEEVIQKAKNLPEIFGQDFECDYRINHIQDKDGKYLGYAWVDVSNPALYYALIGRNVDGTDRIELIDDPDHPATPVKEESDDLSDGEMDYSQPIVFTDSGSDWGQLGSSPKSPPKLRISLPPLLTMGEYEYDFDQKAHFDHKSTHGTIKVSPGYIVPGVGEGCDDRVLFVQNVPEKDYDFLYTIFGRYARFGSLSLRSSLQPSDSFYPRIRFRKQGDRLAATVEYENPYDAAYALTMSKKIRVIYQGRSITLITQQSRIP